MGLQLIRRGLWARPWITTLAISGSEKVPEGPVRGKIASGFLRSAFCVLRGLTPVEFDLRVTWPLRALCSSEKISPSTGSGGLKTVENGAFPLIGVRYTHL